MAVEMGVGVREVGGGGLRDAQQVRLQDLRREF